MRLGTSNEDYRLQKRPLLGVLEITLASRTPRTHQHCRLDVWVLNNGGVNKIVFEAADEGYVGWEDASGVERGVRRGCTPRNAYKERQRRISSGGASSAAHSSQGGLGR